MGGTAWVTLATNDSYALGALVVANSLKRVNTVHDLAILITPGVTLAMKTELLKVFNFVKEVDVFDSRDESNLRLLSRPDLGITFTKIHAWKLTQYSKCVFLDADVLVVQNCDELFDREELSAAPDAGWPDCFNSGVFVFKPSDSTYNALVDFALVTGSFDGGDQGLLNLFFSDWATGDTSRRLPFVYNMCSTSTYSYLPALKQFGSRVKIIHFIGSSKPWLQHFDASTRTLDPSSSHISNFLQLWWDVFVVHVHPTLSTEMSGLARALAQVPIGTPISAEQLAYEDHMHRQHWEEGHIDYLGKDSWDNIWKKISSTIEPTKPAGSELTSEPSKSESVPTEVAKPPEPVVQPSTLSQPPSVPAPPAPTEPSTPQQPPVVPATPAPSESSTLEQPAVVPATPAPSETLKAEQPSVESATPVPSEPSTPHQPAVVPVTPDPSAPSTPQQPPVTPATTVPTEPSTPQQPSVVPATEAPSAPSTPVSEESKAAPKPEISPASTEAPAKEPSAPGAPETKPSPAVQAPADSASAPVPVVPTIPPASPSAEALPSTPSVPTTEQKPASPVSTAIAAAVTLAAAPAVSPAPVKTEPTVVPSDSSQTEISTPKSAVPPHVSIPSGVPPKSPGTPLVTPSTPTVTSATPPQSPLSDVAAQLEKLDIAPSQPETPPVGSEAQPPVPPKRKGSKGASHPQSSHDGKSGKGKK